ncbi:MAG: hypothetical protein NXI31_17060 [bacterium]|nr:hypothetical protein [bacterium]
MPRNSLWTTAAVALGLALVAIVLRLAWVGDDAYITLRTVENFVQGRGLVWNAGERLQCYTHPLWMLLLVGARVFTGECYFGTIGLSCLLAIVAVVTLARLTRGVRVVAVVVWSLIWARSFSEYAVCGLETPLTFALLAWLCWFAGRPRGNVDGRERGVAPVALVVALLACTRLDLMLVGAPLVLAALPAIGWRRWFLGGLLGALPLIAWLTFATIYYGSPLPITAAAKLGHGLPTSAILSQGLQHFVFMLQYDPVTLLIITVGIVVGLTVGVAGNRALAIGALLYLGYIVKVGGDFMGGRFFTPPLIVAVAILARSLPAQPARIVAMLAISVPPALGFVGGMPAWLLRPASETEPTWHHRGVLDERSAYVRQLGLFSLERKVPVPGGASAMLRSMGRTRPIIATHGKAGVYAFEGGELMRFFDPLLCDVLLARLPASATQKWRVGHVPRDLPTGYLEQLAFGGHRIQHEGLRRYYDALATITRAPVFSAARWQVCWRFWTGGFAADLQSYVNGPYRSPPRLTVAATGLAESIAGQVPGLGPLWFDDARIRIVPRGGLAIAFQQPVSARALATQLAGGLVYRWRLRRGAEVVADVTTDMRATSHLVGLVPQQVALARELTFDRIDLDVIDPPPDLVPAVGRCRPRVE